MQNTQSQRKVGENTGDPVGGDVLYHQNQCVQLIGAAVVSTCSSILFSSSEPIKHVSFHCSQLSHSLIVM